MNCAWDALRSILPQHLRKEEAGWDRETLQEIRLRLNQPTEFVLGSVSVWVGKPCQREDLSFVVNAASRYSPWAAATASQGYVTAPGGHRIGICGTCSTHQGCINGIRQVSSLCIRVAKDIPGIGSGAPAVGSVLILGPPGSGKTTLLRDIIRSRSNAGPGSIAVVDERGELFPPEADFCQGKRTDVITGCTKGQGIDAVLRTMGPTTVAVDEITSYEDCAALLQAGWCGVSLLATAHASSIDDLLKRNVYKPLVEQQLFDTLLVMNRDKTWKQERGPRWL